MYSGLRLFKTAFVNTRRHIFVSGVFLVAITFVLTVIMYLAEALKDGSQSTISNEQQYAQFCDAFASMVKDAFGFETALHSSRYPLMKKNLGYTIRKDHPDRNAFVLRPSSELMNFDDRKLLIAFRMAQIISEQLDNGKGITDDEVKDLKETGFGYQEKELRIDN